MLLRYSVRGEPAIASPPTRPGEHFSVCYSVSVSNCPKKTSLCRMQQLFLTLHRSHQLQALCLSGQPELASTLVSLAAVYTLFYPHWCCNMCNRRRSPWHVYVGPQSWSSALIPACSASGENTRSRARRSRVRAGPDAAVRESEGGVRAQRTPEVVQTQRDAGAETHPNVYTDCHEAYPAQEI